MDLATVQSAIRNLRLCVTSSYSDQETSTESFKETTSKMHNSLQVLLKAPALDVYRTLSDTFAKLNDIPVSTLLAIPEPEMPVTDNLASVTLTDSIGTGILPLHDWKMWTDFKEEFDQHYQMHFGNSVRNLPKPISIEECSWGESVRYLELSSEAKLDVNLKHFYDKVNLALKCTGYDIELQGGKHQSGGDRRIPDLAANTGVDKLLPPDKRINRCPGELKLSVKFGTTMKQYMVAHARAQAYLAVFSQLHHYMNVHGAKTGYILTDRELYAMRRYGTEWGLVEVSNPIPFKPTHHHSLNAKQALWFLLSKYGCHATEWSHPSFKAPDLVPATIDDVIGPETSTESPSDGSQWTHTHSSIESQSDDSDWIHTTERRSGHSDKRARYRSHVANQRGPQINAFGQKNPTIDYSKALRHRTRKNTKNISGTSSK